MSNVTELNLNKSYNAQQHPFHLVKPSPWPIVVGFAVFMTLVSAVFWFHGRLEGAGLFLRFMKVGTPVLILSVCFWLWDVIIEGTFEGRHTLAVQHGLRLGFALFIVSEVMFFVGFFWAFFYLSISPSIWIGCVWPPLGIQPINPWGLPLLNTAILLSSGVTATWAHKAMVAVKTRTTSANAYNARSTVLKALAATIGLGLFFTSIQLYEYKNSGFSINDGAYGSLFFMLTGFHGFHVLVGTIFLIVCLLRHIAYHFTRDHHVGLEAALWYWHFVDVVWIFLYVFVYVLGS